MEANYIVLTSVGPLVVATAGGMFCLFQLWLYFWRLGQEWNLWAGALSLGLALYAVAVFFDYNLGEGAASITAERLEYSCLLALIHSSLGFSMAYLSLPHRRYQLFAVPFHLVVLGLTWFTPLVVSDRFVSRDFTFLPEPYVEPLPGPLGGWFLLYCFATALVVYAIWFRQRRRHQRDFRYFSVAFFLWLALAGHDFLVTVNLIRSSMYLMEFGFFGFLVTLLGFTLMRYSKMELSLRQSQKMEAIGTMAGGVAHEFNNILQVLQGQAELMRANPHLPPELRPDLEGVSASLTRARDLVRRLLTVGRRVAAQAVRVDLNHEVRLVAGILERTLPRMIAVDLDLSPSLQPIKGDPGQLEQLLLNLASNASDAMPEGGRLTLATANLAVRATDPTRHQDMPPGNYVVLRVADTGQGMDPETLQRCFDPFFTTKEVGKGTGLGLSTVYAIVEAHHGVITCDSAPGRGTSFSIFLPVEAAPAAAPAPAPAPPAPVSGHGGLILLVDDEPAIRASLAEYLGKLGYEVLQAGSGEEALKIYSHHREQTKVVILDLSMPGMGGKACLRRLRENDPQAKVLVASGYGGADVAREMAGLGAAGFIAKPFRLAELERALSGLESEQA